MPVSGHAKPVSVSLANPTLDSDLTGWTVTGNSTDVFQYSTFSPYSGAGCAYVSTTSAGSRWTEINQTLSPISAGNDLNFTVWINTNWETSLHPSATLFIQWLDDLNNQIGTNETTTALDVFPFEQFSVNGTAPALTTKANVGIRAVLNDNGNWVKVDEFGVTGEALAEFSESTVVTTVTFLIFSSVAVLVIRRKPPKI